MKNVTKTWSRLGRVKGEIEMADVKVTAAAKPVAKAVAAAKPVEAAKAETKATETKAATAKKAPAKKETAEKKTAAKKETAEKKAPAKKATTTAAKAEAKAVVNLQFSGKSYTTEDLVKIAKDVWKYDLKKKVSDFKTVELYVKPEESQVYYVINEEVTGSFGI